MTFKVVKIVDEYLIVVNYGLIHNAREGDTLEVIMVGEEVFDPETSKSLGTLDMIKGRVKVKNVYAQMSLCISDEKTVNIDPVLKDVNSTLLSFSKLWSSNSIKALPINTKQITGGYDEEVDLIINIGDLVKIKNNRFTSEVEEEDEDEEEGNLGDN